MTLLWYPFVFVLPPVVGLHVCMPFFPSRLCPALYRNKRLAQPAVTALSTFCSLCIFFYFQLAFSSWSRAGPCFLTPPCHSTCPPLYTLDRYTRFPVFILYCNTLPLQAYLSCSAPWVPALISFLARLFALLPLFTCLHLVRQIFFTFVKLMGIPVDISAVCRSPRHG